MPTGNMNSNNPWKEFFGPNLGYVAEQYEQFKNDPEQVDPELTELFESWGAPPSPSVTTNDTAPEVASGDTTSMKKVVAAVKLADNIRAYGHLSAEVNPLGTKNEGHEHLLDPEKYELTNEDLKAIPANVIWEEAPAKLENGLDVIKELKSIYTRSIAFQVSHIPDGKERKWLNQIIETGEYHQQLSKDQQVNLLKRLMQVESFEKFLHKTFVGQKRFSIEGLDSLVPMLDETVREGVKDGANDIMIGMAHRGRLNVLTHILGKPYENIFAEFQHAPNKDLVPSEGSSGINYGWTGDVKYHLGANLSIEEGDAPSARLTLANNPSHLEYVNPVIEGYARAAQEDRGDRGVPSQDINRAFAILIHGDAAFPGEGIVSETLNLSRLSGYHTGGTVHIIANNLLGFTTESNDSRSTVYASDLAKGFEIPVVHVNADDPEACLAAIHLAYEYRKHFKKDFLIDLIGYRRFGHNEMDDPAATQPDLYAKIRKHPTAKTSYGQKLVSEGITGEEDVKTLEDGFYQNLQEVYDKVKAGGKNEIKELDPPKCVAKRLNDLKTEVDATTLSEINDHLLEWPEGFNVYPKLKKILERRKGAFEEGGKLDWSHAETMAYATILADGTPIRLTGQDSQRGTFAQRHLVLHDSKTGEGFSPLHQIPEANASFAIHNSPLSEASVIGFEYGYNVFAPETLVLWEAQFGDFVNAGQVIIDQFIAAGRAKWGQMSSLVMLLPHGYEGQGPEHSSGRLERFLHMAAENNWTVANLTSSAQYFHILRRQAAITGKDEARPLIIMTPKSLLRHPLVASEAADFSDKRFNSVLEQPGLGKKPKDVKRLIMASGKVGIDLAEQINDSEKGEFDWLHIARVEQIYPFPKEEVKKLLKRFKNLEEIVWVQEEPKNMGAWTFMEPRINELAPEGVATRYVGRPYRSSPATGEADIHKKGQARLIEEALKK